MKEVKHLKVKPSLEDFLPALENEEYKLLEEDILKHGIMMPIDTWDGFIIDGHHRYKISRIHNIPFEERVHPKSEFKNLKEVMLWMALKQKSRRNMTPTNLAYLIGNLYNQTKDTHGRYSKVSGHYDHLLSEGKKEEKTESEIAKAFDVSPKKVRRDAEFAQIVDEAGVKFGTEAREKLLNDKEYRIPVIKRKKIKESLKKGEYKSLEDLLESEGVKTKPSFKAKPKTTVEVVEDTSIKEIKTALRKMSGIVNKLSKGEATEENYYELESKYNELKLLIFNIKNKFKNHEENS